MQTNFMLIFICESIDRDMAMSLPAVTKAVSFICDTISTIPIYLYKETDGKVKEVGSQDIIL